MLADMELSELAENSQYVTEALARWPDDVRGLDPDGPATELAGDWRTRPEEQLRRLRQLESVRIAWRDVLGRDDFTATGRAITRLAEQVIEAALEIAEARIKGRFGTLKDEAGEPIRLCVLGMGKLGGGELNFNSDVDLMYVHRKKGRADGPRRLEAREYLGQVARELGQILDRVTEHGRVWAVDTRLRPFGGAGSLVWSNGAMEQYYLSEGRTWERYALLKMKPVAGDLRAGQDLSEALRPFVYRRYLDYGIFESLREMHHGIRREARSAGNEDDLKVGPGGIRALEFIVQSIQLLRGGRHRELRTPGFLDAVEACRGLELMDAAEAESLAEDYRYLRTAENRLQMVTGRQTQRIPREEEPRRRLVRLMGADDWDGFRAELQTVRERSESAFQTRFESDEEARGVGEQLWPLPEESVLAERLGQHGVEEAGEQARALIRTGQRINRQPLSQEGRRRLDGLMPLLLEDVLELDHPDPALADLLRLLEAIVRRSAYIALLREHPPVLERLVRIFATSGRVAGWIIDSPQLLDDLLLPGHDHRLPGLPRLREDDPEHNLFELARYRQTGFLRTALGELESRLDAEQARSQLTRLAESILQALVDHSAGEGESLAVIGYGNLGAGALHYESDLDLVFLFDRDGAGNPQRRVQRLISLLEAPAPGGRLYEIDTRLRPNGRAGLLVSPLDAFAEYQREEAWTWEHQALIRARWVAGDPGLGERFEGLRREILCRERDADKTRSTLADMRRRQQTQRREDRFRRVLTHIQFAAELGLLLEAHRNPELAECRSTGEALGALEASGWLDAEDARQLAEVWERAGHARHHSYLRRQAVPGPNEPETEAVEAIHARLFRLQPDAG